MAFKYPVPKFITIEDKLAGLLTFRQLFALLGAFLLTYFIYKVDKIVGIVVGVISFGSAVLLTFVNVNGKPLINILPRILEFFLKSNRYVWKRIEKISYKEVEIPEIEETEEIKVTLPKFKKREKVYDEKITFDVTYPEVSPNVKESLSISLNEPIANQVSEISKIIHSHTLNPKNPYRLFPYIKFYKSFK